MYVKLFQDRFVVLNFNKSVNKLVSEDKHIEVSIYAHNIKNHLSGI